jgi:predicted dehydrogenase
MEYSAKLKFGMVGGGFGGNIGKSHLRGALMDNLAVLSAGCFSRNQEQNRQFGALWGVPEQRVYEDYKQMAVQES